MSWVEQRIRRLWYPVVLAGVATLSLISMGEFEPVEGSLYAALFLGAAYLGLKKRAARPQAMVDLLKPVLWITALAVTVTIVVWAGVRFVDGDAIPLASILVSTVAAILLHGR